MPKNASQKERRKAARQLRREKIATMRAEYMLLHIQGDPDWSYYCNGHPNAVNIPRLYEVLKYMRDRQRTGAGFKPAWAYGP